MAVAIFNHIAPHQGSGVGIPQGPRTQQPLVGSPTAPGGAPVERPQLPGYTTSPVHAPVSDPALEARRRLAALSPEQKAAFARFAASGAKPHSDAIPPSGLSAAQLANYQNQTDTANLTYQQQLAQNEFLRANENAQYGTTRGNTLDQYAKVRAALPSQYEGRGLLNSGIYGQGLQDENTAKLNALQQILQSHQQVQSGYDLSQTQQEQSRNATLAQIAAARAAAIQQLASQLAQPH